jgi:arabinose-5-phosphate isomerase
MPAFRASLSLGAAAIARANAGVDLAAADAAVAALLGCGGRRLCTGVGKSGLAAARLASSLSSIGLPAAYVSASEWEHGELGGVRAGDVVVAVSFSGASAELLRLAPRLKQRQAQMLALTGAHATPLGQAADITVPCAAAAEDELLGVLPTVSTLATHHVINALLCECAHRMGLDARAVRENHPGGAIGRAASDEPVE